MKNKKKLSALLVLALFLAAVLVPGDIQKVAAADGDLEWAKDAGGTLSDFGRGIAVDGSGNSYVTGTYDTSATFGEGGANQTTLSGTGPEIFIAKYNTNGTLVWAKDAGGSSSDNGYGITADDGGNTYVTGNYYNAAVFGAGEVNQTTLSGSGPEIFIAKYNTNGTLVWAKGAGGSSGDDRGQGIAVDGSGYIYVTGYYYSAAVFGAGETNETALSGSTSEVFVAKYNNNGTLVWAKGAGGTNSDYGFGIAVDGSGNSYVTGHYHTTATFGAGEVNETTLLGSETEVFVAKYNSAGVLLWAKDAGGSANDYGHGIAADSSGNSYVTGYYGTSAVFGAGEANQTTLSGSNSEIFAAKYNSDGALVWAKDAGGGSGDYGHGIAVDGSGNSYVTGYYNTSAVFGAGEVNQTTLSGSNSEVFIAKYNTNGALVWAIDAGGALGDWGKGIAVDSNGSTYITGYYNTATVFGAGEVNETTLSGSGTEIFVAKYAGSRDLCIAGLCNGSFESDIDLEHWQTGNGTNQIVTDVVQGGNKAYYSEHTYDTGENPKWSGIKQDMIIEPAQVYALSGYFQSENAARGHIKITWKDITGAVMQIDYPVHNMNGTNSTWIEFSKLVTAPAEAVAAELKIWHGLDGSDQNVLGSKVWLDSLTFDRATASCGTLCNESFEHGLLYWKKSGKVGSNTIEQTGAFEGTKAVRSEQLYTSAEEVKWTGVSQFAQVKEGVTYRLKGWFKTLNAVNGQVRIRWRNDAGSELSTEYPISGINGTNATWFKQESIVTAPAEAAKAEITIWHGVTVGPENFQGSTIWIDNITLICQSLCNGGFEEGLAHWDINGLNEAEIITTNVQEGTHAIKTAQNLDNTYNAQWAGINQSTLVTGGQSYNLSFWIKKESAVQGHIKIKWRDADDQLISQQFPIGGINGTDLTWVQIDTTLTAPANAETVEIFIWHGVDSSNQNVPGSILYLDNVTFGPTL